MILLWGLDTDSPLAMVGEELEGAGAPVFFLDQQRVGKTTVTLDAGPEVSGRLCDGSHSVELHDVTATYVRPFDTRRMADVEAAGPHSHLWANAMLVDDTLLGWCEITPAVVVNRPSAMASNNSKPYQAVLIRRQGFAVPDTLVTTDPEAARDFWRAHGQVIYKSVSGIRSVVSRLGGSHDDRLEDIVNCPTQFQQHIAGTDVRIHVVGNEIFAAEIRSDADDYRYAERQHAEVTIVETALPATVADRARALTASLGLSVAGLDLRRTQDGEWYCFEVNPSPAFSYYQHATGQPIAAAVARLLVGDLPEATAVLCEELSRQF